MKFKKFYNVWQCESFASSHELCADNCDTDSGMENGAT